VRDVVVVLATLAFFALGAAYVMACARILDRSGDIDEPLPMEADDLTVEDAA
jgi:hypothetical protein